MTARTDRELLELAAKAAGNVAGWLFEDELPKNYPYDAIFPYSRVDGVRMFPVYRPTPALTQQERQIADLVLHDGLRVSSPLESGTGFGDDIEHRFEVSDGEQRFGVAIILTRLKAAGGAT